MHTLVVAPTYNGDRSNGKAIWQLANYRDEIDFFEFQSSCLTHSFNYLWTQALNNRDAGITHFLMIHADIQPRQDKWFRILHDEMAATDAAVLSVVSPIKSNKGLTSTAVNSDHWRPRRYTLKEMAAMPPTFTLPDLLINTGLMLVNLSGPWVEEVCFDVNNLVYKAPNGRWKSEMEPEDWHFSRQLHVLGVRPYVTQKVTLDHRGASDFPNFGTHGWDYDMENAPEE